MLGYVKPQTASLSVAQYRFYQSIYCGLCHTMGRRTCASSRLFLSYDFVFLALVRQALCGKGVVLEKRRCMAHPLRRRPAVRENEALRYAACAAAVLREYKLRDDIADERGARRLAARLLRALSRGAYRRGRGAVDTGAIEQSLLQLACLEREKNGSFDAPADAFGALLSEIFSFGLAKNEGLIAREIGFACGRWIYFADAADDLAKDAESGAYNPLLYLGGARSGQTPAQILKENRSALQSAMLQCCERMERAAALIDYGERDMTKALIENIIYRGLPAQTDDILRGRSGKTPREELPEGGDIVAFADGKYGRADAARHAAETETKQ